MTRRWSFGSFIAVAAICAGSYGLSEWRGGYSASFLSWGMAVLLGMALLSGLGMRRIRAERMLSQYRFFAGDDAHVILDVRRGGPVPSGWMIVSDVWTDGLREYRHSRLLFPGFRSEIRLRYKLKHLARGHYRFVRIEVDAGDWLGLLRKNVTLPVETEFAVYPKPLSLNPAAQGETSESGNPALRRRPDHRSSPIVTSVRAYTPGDPLQRIHWKATARSGLLQTKVTEPLESERLAVVLDVSRNGFIGTSGESLFETAVRAVAGLLEWTVKEGALASVYAGSAPTLSLPPARRFDLLDVYELLSRARLDDNGSGADMLLRESAGWAGGSSVVIVTSVADESLARAARILRTSRLKLMVWLVRFDAPMPERQRRLIEELEASGCRVRLLRAPRTHADAAQAGGAEDVIA